jgi:hypothetical protein
MGVLSAVVGFSLAWEGWLGCGWSGGLEEGGRGLCVLGELGEGEVCGFVEGDEGVGLYGCGGCCSGTRNGRGSGWS